MERVTRKQFLKNGTKIIGYGMFAGGAIEVLGITASRIFRSRTADIPHPSVNYYTTANAVSTETTYMRSLGTPVAEAVQRGQSEITIPISSEMTQARQVIDQGKANDLARSQAGQLGEDESAMEVAGLGLTLTGALIAKIADIIQNPKKPQQENNLPEASHELGI